MTIRPYEDRDREDVRFICLNSEGPCKLPESKRHFILTTYCDYFIEKEGANCFVAANENDKAVGYVICAENYDKFLPCFLSEYLPRIKKYEVKLRYASKNSTILQEKHKNEYPAHLHIDVLPEYQRMGLGHKMVDALCAHLKSKGIKGVMLTVGKDNKVGQGFYKKYGFTLLESNKKDVAFGIKL